MSDRSLRSQSKVSELSRLRKRCKEKNYQNEIKHSTPLKSNLSFRNHDTATKSSTSTMKKGSVKLLRSTINADNESLTKKEIATINHNSPIRKSCRDENSNYNNISVSEHVSSAEIQHDYAKKSFKQGQINLEIRNCMRTQGVDSASNNPQDLSTPDIYCSVKNRRRKSKRFFDEEVRESGEENEKEQVLLQDGITDQVESDIHMYSPANTRSNSKILRDTNTSCQKSESEDEIDVTENDVNNGRYSLRTHRAQPHRLIYELEQREPRRQTSNLFDHIPDSPKHRSGGGDFLHHQSPYQHRKRKKNTQVVSSSTSSSDEESKFVRRKKRSIKKARNRCLPMNLAINDVDILSKERQRVGTSLADVEPMGIDKNVKFSSVGGHHKHISSLKEMIVFPLLYPEVFKKFHISPTRGCLFYGPPGTGKTLLARALANECSSENRKVAFFMRKGADCLSKWIGESERQLRLLFDQAYQMRPSIIFFDEIDGLAPVRSSRQDHIHSCIVSTLLALMDGLDNRGEIVVIGATNRIDSIDPALRRPGRFDKEFLFPLPDKTARREIIKIHTGKWKPLLCEDFIKELAEKCVGYCGADIKSLCTETSLVALRKRYPQIYKTNHKLKLDLNSINISVNDFYKAMKRIVPTAQRSNNNPGYELNPTIKPLLHHNLIKVIKQIHMILPIITKKSKILNGDNLAISENNISEDSDSELEEEITFPPINGLNNHNLIPDISRARNRDSIMHRPRVLICGQENDGQTEHLAPAILHDLESLPVHVLDYSKLFSSSFYSPEEACSNIFREAERSAPSIIYLPTAAQWWEHASESVRWMLNSLLQSLPAAKPVLFLATVSCEYHNLIPAISSLFSAQHNEVFTVINPSTQERINFLAPLFLKFATKVSIPKQNRPPDEDLEREDVEDFSVRLTREEVERVEASEESTMRSLRLFLRDVLSRLAKDQRFKVFLNPVDTEKVNDYTDIIYKPMDISTMMSKIDQHKYHNVASFKNDIDLICDNALEYNPDHCAQDKAIRHRACLLKDMAHAIIEDDLDPKFEELCDEVAEARVRRQADPYKFAPSYCKVSTNKSAVDSPVTIEATIHSTSTSEKNQKSISSTTMSTRKKKRRRKSTWSKGVIPKNNKHKPKIIDILDTSCEDIESLSGSLLDAESTTKNVVKKNEKNALATIIVEKLPQQQEDSDCNVSTASDEAIKNDVEMTQDVEDKSIPKETIYNRNSGQLASESQVKTQFPPIVVDSSKLNLLLKDTVDITSSWRISQLESIHSILSRCVYLHRHDFDKTLLLRELTEILETYVM